MSLKVRERELTNNNFPRVLRIFHGNSKHVRPQYLEESQKKKGTQQWLIFGHEMKPALQGAIPNKEMPVFCPGIVLSYPFRGDMCGRQ